MEDAWGKADVLLELLLDPSAPGALLEDHLLVHFILPKGVDRNQVSSGKERPRSVIPQSLALVPTVSPRGGWTQVKLPLAFGADQSHTFSSIQILMGPGLLLMTGEHLFWEATFALILQGLLPLGRPPCPRFHSTLESAPCHGLSILCCPYLSVLLP